MVTEEHDYDIAVTFAGEDRQFVSDVVRQVTDAGFKVFYDQDEQVAMWGEDLTEYFPRIYEERSRFAVMFISRSYAAKPWTRLERRSVLVRALEQASPYLLPVRLDDTKLPGVRPTIGFLDGEALGPAGIARAIREKLGNQAAEGAGTFNGHVPRDEHEATALLGERPAAWEYLLFSYALVRGVETLNDRYLDHRIRYAKPSTYIADDEVQKVLERDTALILSIVRNFNSILQSEPQAAAFGLPGEPGNADHIVHLASRYVEVYESFLEWAERIRGYTTRNAESHDLFRALARYAEQPIERLRRFVYEFRDEADSFTERLNSGERVEFTPTIELEIAPEATAEFESALERYIEFRNSGGGP